MLLCFIFGWYCILRNVCSFYSLWMYIGYNCNVIWWNVFYNVFSVKYIGNNIYIRVCVYVDIFCGFGKYGGGCFEYVWCWGELFVKNVMNLWDGWGCDIIFGILVLFFYILWRFGFVCWLEIMWWGEFVGVFLILCFSLIFY